MIVDAMNALVGALNASEQWRLWVSDTHCTMMRYGDEISGHPVAYADPECFATIKAFVKAHWGVTPNELWPLKAALDDYRDRWAKPTATSH